ncbi:hypothetical protein BDZ89DRAFT_1073466 [Hymenopellis radicata]|nr:hypothetical protein BDZ89DRAFT_1073466 [Hymenopellis radicata]
MDPPQSSRRRHHGLRSSSSSASTRGATPPSRGGSTAGSTTTAIRSPSTRRSPSSSPSERPAHRQPPHREATPSRSVTAEAPTDFMRKLARILQDNSFQHVVSWTLQGDAFVVKNVTEFSRTVLPRTYKHQNFSSFVRQLNKYDFHKVSAKEGAEDTDNSSTFRHPDFRSDGLGALHKIKRKVTVPRRSYASVVSGTQNSASLTGTVDLESQVQDIAETQRAMSAHIQGLEKNYHDVLEELVGLQQRMAQQDRLTQTLIHYIIQAGQTQALSTTDTTSSIHSGSSDAAASGSSLSWTVRDYPGASSTAHQTEPLTSRLNPTSESSYSSSSPTAWAGSDEHTDLRRRIAVLERRRAELRDARRGPELSMTHDDASEQEAGEEEEDDEMVMPSAPLQQNTIVPLGTSRRMLLQTLGYAFDVAVDGAEAVQKMAEERYDIVLMDVVMPSMDGVAATRIIRRSNHRTPIIAMTSLAQQEAVATYSAAGMNDVLRKPFNMAGLRSLMDRHLGRADESQQRIPLNTHMTEDQYASLVQDIVRRHS